MSLLKAGIGKVKKLAVSRPAVAPVDDLPDPGGHPASMTTKTTPDSPFARLQAMAVREQGKAIRKVEPESPGYAPAEDLLDDLMDRPAEVKRVPLKLVDEKKRLVELRKTAPVLTPSRYIDATEETRKLRPTSEKQLTLFDSEVTGEAVAPADAEAEERESAAYNAGVSKYTERQELDVATLLSGLPGVVCNNCPAAESCPEFKENATCAFDKQFEALPSRDLNNLIPTMELVADIQRKRAMRAFFLEQRVAGGQLDPNVTRQLEAAAEATERVARLKAPAEQMARQSITVVQQGGSGGGLISRLLAGVTGALPQRAGEIELQQKEPVTVVHAEASYPQLGEGKGSQ